MAEKPEKKTTPQERYKKKNMMQVKLELNTQSESDIVERLNQTGNKQQYIKNLIRLDIKNNKIKGEEEMKKLIEFANTHVLREEDLGEYYSRENEARRDAEYAKQDPEGAKIIQSGKMFAGDK